MHDYYSFYTWAMDRQAKLEREAAERRLLRESGHLHLRLRLPIPVRRRPAAR
jgi:hypothetical protein